MNRTEVETCRVDNKSKYFVLSKDLKENEGKDVDKIFRHDYANNHETVSRDSNARIGIKGNARQFMRQFESYQEGIHLQFIE